MTRPPWRPEAAPPSRRPSMLNLPLCTPPGAALLGDSTLVSWYRSLYAPRTGGAPKRRPATTQSTRATRWECSPRCFPTECSASSWPKSSAWPMTYCQWRSARPASPHSGSRRCWSPTRSRPASPCTARHRRRPRPCWASGSRTELRAAGELFVRTHRRVTRQRHFHPWHLRKQPHPPPALPCYGFSCRSARRAWFARGAAGGGLVSQDAPELTVASFVRPERRRQRAFVKGASCMPLITNKADRSSFLSERM
jgi:hypothetical protein